MPITRALPLEELYERVSEYELVVVPDQPLASALNRRLDRPRLGPFAVRPRRLAAGRRETAEDRTAFLEVVRRSDLDWKEAAYEIGNVLQCWEHEGRVDAILQYDAYADEATETVASILEEIETTSGALTSERIDDGRDVAVVGEAQLTPLERSVLPDEYDTVDPFTAEPLAHPPFRVFESRSAVVDALVSNVSAETADDVAVVLDRASAYAPLVESAFEAAGTPFYGGPGFADDPDHRAFCQLLRVAHRGTDTRVRAVRPVLHRLGVDVGIEHDEKRLHDVDAAAVEWVLEFCEGIGERTFAEALTAFERRSGTSLDAFRAELRELGLADALVTEAAVDRLAFYLGTYEVPLDRENEGVLLADATATAYVDRPAVFFLGLDEGWTRSTPNRPWIDRDETFERDLRAFQLLLQSGDEQYYLVVDTAEGRPVTPCPYFDELFETSYERFSDFESVRHGRPPRRDPDGSDADSRVNGFERRFLDVPTTAAETLSQSALNAYVTSPRDYLFDRLLEGPDRDYFEEGSLFHDFAEFCVAHPDAVDDEVIEDAVELMIDRTGPLVRRVERETRRTRYRVGLETIREFLEENPPVDGAFLTPTSGWGTNAFAERYDRPIRSPRTERWFENERLGLEGKIDLVHGPTRLLDYKSGGRKRAARVVDDSSVDPPSDTPDFQALSYLAHWRTERPDERLEFTFFHFLETLEDVVAGEADLSETLTTVTYHPTSFEEHARSRETFEHLRANGAGNCRKTLESVGHEEYRSVFESTPMPEAGDSDELIESAFGEAMETRLTELVGAYKYVESGCRQLMRELVRIRDRNYFREDLDAFERFVEDRLAELNRRRRGEERFPVEGPAGEPNYRYVDNRDLLLEGDD